MSTFFNGLGLKFLNELGLNFMIKECYLVEKYKDFLYLVIIEIFHSDLKMNVQIS